MFVYRVHIYLQLLYLLFLIDPLIIMQCFCLITFLIFLNFNLIHSNSLLPLFKIFYLFYFWQHWVLIAVRLALFCCVWAFSSCSEGQLLSVVAHGLSFPMTCGILVLRPGIKPKSPALAGGCLASGPPGKSSIPYFKVYFV